MEKKNDFFGLEAQEFVGEIRQHIVYDKDFYEWIGEIFGAMTGDYRGADFKELRIDPPNPNMPPIYLPYAELMFTNSEPKADHVKFVKPLSALAKEAKNSTDEMAEMLTVATNSSTTHRTIGFTDEAKKVLNTLIPKKSPYEYKKDVYKTVKKEDGTIKKIPNFDIITREELKPIHNFYGQDSYVSTLIIPISLSRLATLIYNDKDGETTYEYDVVPSGVVFESNRNPHRRYFINQYDKKAVSEATKKLNDMLFGESYFIF